MDEQLETLQQIQATAVDSAVRFGPKLLVAVIIIGLGMVAGRWCGKTAERLLDRFNLEPPVK